MERKINYIDETDKEFVLRAFKSFSKDNDGKITNYEFKYILIQKERILFDINRIFIIKNL